MGASHSSSASATDSNKQPETETATMAAANVEPGSVEDLSGISYVDVTPTECGHGIYVGTLPEPNLPREDCVRFVAISDTHNLTNELQLPDGDVLLHGGDFSNTGTIDNISHFNDFLKRVKDQYKEIVLIAGNHDLTFHPEHYDAERPKSMYTYVWERFHRANRQDPELARAQLTEGVYLEDSGAVIEGAHIYGSPWQPEFCDWAFNLDRGEPLREKWALIPDSTDILITHGPPYGHGDECSDGFRAGCKDLLETIMRIEPLVHVSGHIHEGYGVTKREGCRTLFINASTCTYSYKPNNPAVVFDIAKSALGLGDAGEQGGDEDE